MRYKNSSIAPNYHCLSVMTIENAVEVVLEQKPMHPYPFHLKNNKRNLDPYSKENKTYIPQRHQYVEFVQFRGCKIPT